MLIVIGLGIGANEEIKEKVHRLGNRSRLGGGGGDAPTLEMREGVLSTQRREEKVKQMTLEGGVVRRRRRRAEVTRGQRLTS